MDYVKSLIKTIFSKGNMGFVCFMIISIAPVWAICARQSVIYALVMFAVLFLFYFLFVVVIGELIARVMLRAYTKVNLSERTVLSVAFSNAYTVAKGRNPIISSDVRLYVFQGAMIDGYAFGRNTLCLSSAALNLPEQDLTTLLLMKFAQFSHHDSEILAFLTAGNVWYIVLAVMCKWYIYLFGCIAWALFAIMGRGFGGFMLGRAFKSVAEGMEKIILGIVGVILMIGVGSYKNNIYENDVFVCNCGYKNALVRFLRDFEPDQVGQETLFGAISSMKPDKHLRLMRIQNYTTSYQDNSSRFRIISRN